MKNRIVFIEGVSGVGKSTSASILYNKLNAIGETFACHLEGGRDNPLDPFKGTYPPPIPLSVFTGTYADCWKHFVGGETEQKLILDGTLLHHQINDMIHFYDASGETILTHLTALSQIIQPMNPIIFYLASANVARRLIHARKNRGQPAAGTEQIAFWENRTRIDLFILENLPLESHILNIENGWDTALETMIEYIVK